MFRSSAKMLRAAPIYRPASTPVLLNPLPRRLLSMHPRARRLLSARPRADHRKSQQNINLTRFLMCSTLIATSYFLYQKHGSDSVATRLQMANILLQQNTTPLKSDIFEMKESKTDLTSFGGYSHVQEAASNLVLYLQNPSVYTNKGLKAPKGIILYGPPGVGKSYIAEAIAGHAGVPIIIANGSSLMGRYVGEGEKNIREIFALAKKSAPCVLCLDEIDSIANSRFESPTQGSEHHANTLVNQLLTLLSSDHLGVIVIATTNNLKSLDKAITRPGRFDRIIEVSLPNKQDRLNILNIHIAGKNLDPSLDLTHIARVCVGFSGAKIASLVEEAALCAIKERSSTISQQHFDKARSLLAFGSYGHVHDDLADKKKVAIHEAGHAVVAHLLGREVYNVSVKATAISNGGTEILPCEKTIYTKGYLEDSICIAVAGRSSEELNESLLCGFTADLAEATKLAKTMIAEGMGSTLTGMDADIEIEKILRTQLHRASKLLKDNQASYDNIIEQLVKHDSLPRDVFLQAFAGKKIPISWSLFKSTSGFVLPPKKKYAPEIKSSSSDSSLVKKISNFTGIPKEGIHTVLQEKDLKIVLTYYYMEHNTSKVVDVAEKLKKLEIDVRGFVDEYDRKWIIIKESATENFLQLVEKGKPLNELVEDVRDSRRHRPM